MSMRAGEQESGKRMRIKKFICVVLISLIGLIGCVGADGSYEPVSTQNPEYEGTGVKDPSSEL